MWHFILAYGVAAALAAIAWTLFRRNLPPRFGDLFLPGVALICARYSWKAALLLFAFSYALLAAVVFPLPDPRSLGHLIFGGTGLMMIWIVELAKRRR